LRGGVDEALRLLAHARDNGDLPSKAHLLSDTDLTALREIEGFKAIVESAKP